MSEAKDKAPFMKMELRMPTPEEHRATSLKWLKRVQPTLIDQWPAELAALSMPTQLVRFPDGLADEFRALHDGAEPGPVMNALAAELDAMMGWNRKFVRLNSRSPKDYPWPFAAPATISGKEALSFLAGSMRVMDDLVEFKYVPEQPVYVCLRDWVYGLRTENEYRCFAKDGELIAVTHYDYTKPWAGPEDKGKELRERIDRWFPDVLRPTLPIDTIVFDIHVNYDGSFLLIEINPYGWSDPCYFRTYEAVENATSFIEYASTEDMPA